MAQEIVGLKVQVDGGEAVQAIGSIKKQLREANLELIKAQESFGVYSKEAITAGKRVAELKDTIKEASEFSNLFDPGQKFQVFANAISAVAGGFSAVQGALGLLGVESENVEKTLVRLQSALALSQGLSTIADSAKDFQRLSAIIQSTTIFQRANNAATIAATVAQRAFGLAVTQTSVAFRVLKGVIASAGIGLLIVGITALISKIQDWTSASDKAAEAQKKLAEKTDLVNSKLNNEIAVLTALGGKEEEIFKKRVEIANNELNVLRASAKQKNGFTQEELKKFGELKTQLVTLELDEKNRIKKINEEAQKKQAEKNKEAADKAKELAKERIQANEDAEEQIRKLRQDAELNAIEDQNKRAIRQAEIDFENRKLEIEALKANEKLKTQLITEEQKKRDTIIADLKNEAIQAELTAIIDGFAAQEAADKAEEERRKAQQQKEFDDIFAQLDRETESERKAAEAKKQIAEEEAKFKKAQLNETANALTSLGEIVGRETAAGKALAIATALINTYQGATEALKQKSTLPSPFDFAAKAINVAAIIASGLKSVKAITAVKVPGGGGGVPTPSGNIISGGGAPPIAPASPQAALTQLDQTTINRLGSATNRAYVIESDITNSQERISRINRAARLG